MRRLRIGLFERDYYSFALYLSAVSCNGIIQTTVLRQIYVALDSVVELRVVLGWHSGGLRPDLLGGGICDGHLATFATSCVELNLLEG